MTFTFTFPIYIRTYIHLVNLLVNPLVKQGMDSNDKCSAKDDTSITSPLDWPASLSMKVSLSSARSQACFDACLDSDPYRAEIRKSTAEGQAEQKTRFTSGEKGHNKDEVKELSLPTVTYQIKIDKPIPKMHSDT